MNNKGIIIYNLYLILVVLFLCALALLYYGSSITELKASIVNPTPILKTYDDITLYNLREEQILNSIMKQHNKETLGTQRYLQNIREEYLTTLLQEKETLTLLMNNTTLKDGESISNTEEYLRKVVYSQTAFATEKETLTINRGIITKHLYLKNRIGKNYPVDFYWDNKETRIMPIPATEVET